MNVGLRIYQQILRPKPALVIALGRGAVGNLADAMHGCGVMDTGIRPSYSPMPRVAGTAITVDLTPGDGLLMRKAIALAEPGDLVVANAHGCIERAVLGGNVCISAQRVGIVAIIVDGSARDAAEAQEIDFPLFARGMCPRSGTSDSGWGEVNVPVALGGIVVNPGDIVVADSEGIVVIPGQWAADVLESLHAVEEKKGRPEDMAKRTAAAGGKPVHDADRVDRILEQRRVEAIPGVYGWPTPGRAI